MASAQVVEMSVNTNNSPSQDYTTNPEDHSNHNILELFKIETNGNQSQSTSIYKVAFACTVETSYSSCSLLCILSFAISVFQPLLRLSIFLICTNNFKFHAQAVCYWIFLIHVQQPQSDVPFAIIGQTGNNDNTIVFLPSVFLH